MDFLDLHTHHSAQRPGVTSIQSLSLTKDIFLAMPKKRLISIGLHPWYASIEKLDTQLQYLRVLGKQENVKMIGECGLDKLKGENIVNQILILEQQIDIGEELKKPLILHCVKAFTELIEIKNRLRINVPMIIHGFNKNQALGKQLVSQGFLLSFGTSLLKQDSGAAKLLQETESFFLETDDGEVSIEELYQVAANMKKCSVDELKALIFANWKRLNLI